MATTTPAKVLLVEGMKEVRLIPELMEHRGVQWETGAGKQREFAVTIRTAGGLVQNPDILSAELKASGLRVLGVVFDADGMTEGDPDRWKQMRGACGQLGIALPEEPQHDGVIFVKEQIRFGVWMMPHNRAPGMLETFLIGLLQSDASNEPLLQYAREAVEGAAKLKAPFKRPVHTDKAFIHTWLAWQDEPGAQLHEAIKWKLLDPHSPNADGFVKWFKELFEFK
jgi:hypothetical protein